MVTYEGLPGPLVCDYWSREQSRARYDDGATFQIGRIDMVANTGTYVDAPFHRFADGDDIAALPLGRLAAMPAIRVQCDAPAIDADAFEGCDLAGKAVLVHTGWDRHWRTPAYFHGHPFLTEAAARLLADAGALFVGIDSYNIDDTSGRTRPVHTVLLGAGIPICEHMCNIGALPRDGFRVSAVPAPVVGMGSFPVRALAEVQG